MSFLSGDNNVSVGAYSGGFSGTSNGSYNVFLGYYAGFTETGSNKLYIENSNSSSPLIYGEFNNDLVRINGNFQATGYLSLNAGTNQINTVELNILDGKTLATGSADNDQLVTKGYVDENDDVGAGLTGSALTSQVIPKWDDAGTQLVDSIISEGSGVVSVNGRLGVGTATPSQPFELVTTGEPAVLFVNRTDGAVMRMVAGEGNAQIGTVTNHLVKFVVNNSWKMKLHADGSLLMSTGGSYNGTWNDASSIRFKENIRELSSEAAASALEELTPVTYNYKKFKDEERVGFIAEHVPEIVANNDRENLSAMDIVALLTRVVKDQQQIIRELKARVEELETQSR